MTATDLLVVVANNNEISVSENVGAITKLLSRKHYPIPGQDGKKVLSCYPAN
ncbi:MAG: 1-deoxy-D-xylulose-5-phosphate synthase N-terminal domain-containing protein [Candidatus Malihini olakiniferum]